MGRKEKEKEREKQRQKEKEKERKSKKGRDDSSDRDRSRSRRRKKKARDVLDSIGNSAEQRMTELAKALNSNELAILKTCFTSAESKAAEPPPPPPPAPEDGSSDEGEKDGISVAEEDIPEFWERVQKLKGEVRNEAVAALDAKSKERLETFLIARAATKKKK